MTAVGQRERGDGGNASDEPQSAEAGAQRRRKPITSAEWVGVVIAVAAGLVFRFVTTSALWLDEALTVNISRLPIADIPGALRHDGHPPLYYFLLHFWMRAFGEGDFAVRSLSGIFAVAALPLAWIAGRMAGGKRSAAAMLVLVALSPFAIRYATEARMYSLVTLLVLAGYIVLLRALRNPRPLF